MKQRRISSKVAPKGRERLKRRNLVALGLCAGALLIQVLSGCGGSSLTKAGASSHSYVATQAPGDVWDWTLSSSTFSANNVTQGITYSGTSALLPSGFYKLNVSASSDAASVGTSAYAFEVPGVALIAEPTGPNTDPVVGTASLVGGLANGTINGNWIAIPPQGWSTGQEAYGTATLMTNGANSTVSGTKYALGGAPIGVLNANLTYSNGSLTEIGGPAKIDYTPAGVLIGDDGPGNGGFVGVQQPAADVDLSAASQLEYRGILFKGGGNSELIWSRSNGSGGMRGGGYIDVDNNVEDNDPTHGVTVNFTSQPSPGLVQGTITVNNATTPIVFVINKAGGKYMIFGFSDDSGIPNNFLLCQK
jgi:hypothetical protein